MFRLPGGCFLPVRPYTMYWSPADCLPACLPVLAEFLSCSPASPALLIVVLRIAVLVPALLVSRHSTPPVACPEGGEPKQSVAGVSWCGAVSPRVFAPLVLV